MHTSYYIIEYMCIYNVCPESVYSYPLSCKYSCYMSIYIYLHISLQKYKLHILFMRTHYSIDTYYYIIQYLYYIYITL